MKAWTVFLQRQELIAISSAPLEDLLHRRHIVAISEHYGLAVDPDAYVWQLSVGEQQRVELVKTLCFGAKFLILDEPMNGLDPTGIVEIRELILRLNREKGITVVLITHHMDEAAKADRVVVIHRGVLRADGKPKDVFSGIEYMHELGLAAPETVELCHELNGLGFDLPLDLLETEDCAQAIYKALGGN